MLQNQLISYARTGAMLAAGWLLTLLAEHFHIVVTPHTRATIATLVGFGIALLYYVIVRALEGKWPQVGILLGVPARPHYPVIGTPATTPAPAAPSAPPASGQAGSAEVLLVLLVALAFVFAFAGLLVHGVRWLLILCVIVAVGAAIAAAARGRDL